MSYDDKENVNEVVEIDTSSRKGKVSNADKFPEGTVQPDDRWGKIMYHTPENPSRYVSLFAGQRYVPVMIPIDRSNPMMKFAEYAINGNTFYIGLGKPCTVPSSLAKLITRTMLAKDKGQDGIINAIIDEIII
jgi:hypothetical protein